MIESKLQLSCGMLRSSAFILSLSVIYSFVWNLFSLINFSNLSLSGPLNYMQGAPAFPAS